MVEPDQLLTTAIRWAKCITPDCNTAYAMSKKALQDSVLRQIEERTMVAIDVSNRRQLLHSKLVNMIRSLLAEFGIGIPKGLRR